MLSIVAKNILKPGKKQEFIDQAAGLIAKSQAEPGNISYDLYEDVGDENVLTFIEVWQDQAAIDIHNASEHFNQIIPKLGKLCSTEIQINIYKMLP